MKKYIYEVFYLLGKERYRLPAMLSLFIVSSFLDVVGLSLIGPYIALVLDPSVLDIPLKQLIESIGLPTEHTSLIFNLGILLLIIFFMKLVASIAINYKIVNFSQMQEFRLRSLLMRSYQSLSYEEYINRNSAEYINSMQNMVAHFSGNVLTPGLRIISEGLMTLSIVSLLAWQNWQLLLTLIALLSSVLIVYDFLFSKKISNYGEEANIVTKGMVQAINESVDGLKEIRVLGVDGFFYRRVKNLASRYCRLHTLASVLTSMPRNLLEMVLVYFIVIIVFVSVSNDGNANLSISTLGIFGIASLRLLPAFSIFSSSLVAIRFSRNSVSHLYSDLLNVSSISKITTNKDFKIDGNLFKTLSLNNVNYRYPGAKHNSLNNISLEINSGEKIGIIGSSGSGKTTLVDILLGLMEPHSGGITYNKVPLQKMLTSWQAKVAYLPQQIFLVDDTLGHNIALGVEDKEIDHNSLEQAIRQSHLQNLVAELPEGINTYLGEKGVRLSGGQRQRIALARAFYHGREVLIMDESTSALDNETEKRIMEEVVDICHNKTLIIIAHRVSTLRCCDRIINMENGHIVNEGGYFSMVENEE